MLDRAERSDNTTRYRDAADLRRITPYSSWSRDAYPDDVTPRDSNADGWTEWARYLKGIQARPGWSVARLARETGIHRSTIFRWIAGETDKIPAHNARRIAEAVGDDPSIALKAAGDMLEQADTDPMLAGLDPNDPVVRRILSFETLDDDERRMMLDRHRENVQLQQRRWLEDLERDVRRRGAA